MKVKELIPLISNRAIINIHSKDGTNLYLSQCSEEYNQSKIEDYFDKDIVKIEIVNSTNAYDGIIRIFVENQEELINISSKEALKDVIPFNFNKSSNIEVKIK